MGEEFLAKVIAVVDETEQVRLETNIPKDVFGEVKFIRIDFSFEGGELQGKTGLVQLMFEKPFDYELKKGFIPLTGSSIKIKKGFMGYKVELPDLKNFVNLVKVNKA